MVKKSVITTALVVALSWITISCTGPIFIKPPAAATTAGAVTPVATVSPPANIMFLVVPLLGLAALGGTIALLGGKANVAA